MTCKALQRARPTQPQGQSSSSSLHMAGKVAMVVPSLLRPLVQRGAVRLLRAHLTPHCGGWCCITHWWAANFMCMCASVPALGCMEHTSCGSLKPRWWMLIE